MNLGAVREGDELWAPRPGDASRQLHDFAAWLSAHGHPHFEGYDELWQWSVEDIEAFWSALLAWSGAIDHGERLGIERRGLTDTTWFPGARLNYVENTLRGEYGAVALVAMDETNGQPRTVTYGELREQVASAATGLRSLGVGAGDRVAAYLPNIPEAVVAFLATASIGAIWTCCSPDFGPATVLDRFRQVDPVVLLVSTSYSYNGRAFDRGHAVRQIADALSTVKAVVYVPTGDPEPAPNGLMSWEDLTSSSAPLDFELVAFDHPLWIVYTSGTTGMPKSILHGHGGVLLEHQKLLRLHLDLTSGDRFFWFSTTGWVMWNIAVGGLLLGASVVLYNGSPTHPGADRLWEVAARSGATFFGMSAAYVEASRTQGVVPEARHELGAVRSVGITGSPLTPGGFAWLYEHLGPEVFVGSMSGGTDVCTAFVGPVPTLPIRAGELQRACLGVDARCVDDDGNDLADEVGELIVSSPLPSMPVGFWGDDSGSRYHDAYFARFLGNWHHGDWVKRTSEGAWVVYGRSDATLNRGGVRMGTAEFYRALEDVAAVQDALVVDLSTSDEGPCLLLLVVLAEDATLDVVRPAIEAALRSQLSPRHVPDELISVARLPHTLNGKRMEIPIKRILQGEAPDAVLDRSAVDDATAVDEVVALSVRRRQAGELSR